MIKFLVWHALFTAVSCELFDQNLGYLVEYAPKYDNYKPRDYHFNYAVSDPHTGDHKSQWEVKENGVVRGAYSLLEPDGTTRIVEYIADDDGFRAIVKKLGTAIHPTTVETHGVVPILGQPLAEISNFPTYSGQVSNYGNVEIPSLYQQQVILGAQPALLSQPQAVGLNQEQLLGGIATSVAQPLTIATSTSQQALGDAGQIAIAPQNLGYGAGIQQGDVGQISVAQIAQPESLGYGAGIQQGDVGQISVAQIAQPESLGYGIQDVSYGSGIEQGQYLNGVDSGISGQLGQGLALAPISPSYQISYGGDIRQGQNLGQVQGLDIGQGQYSGRGGSPGPAPINLVPISPSYETSITYGLNRNPEDDSRYSSGPALEGFYYGAPSQRVQKVVPAPNFKHSAVKRVPPNPEKLYIYYPDPEKQGTK